LKWETRGTEITTGKRSKSPQTLSLSGYQPELVNSFLILGSQTGQFELLTGRLTVQGRLLMMAGFCTTAVNRKPGEAMYGVKDPDEMTCAFH
jgi:hypothetical protein